jgi:membrane-associated protein
MDWLAGLLRQFVDFIRILTTPERLIELLSTLLTGVWGYAAMFGIVFAETGLLAGFMLPGDSFLFTVGVVARAGKLDLFTINVLLIAAAILGDTVGYYLGRKAGPRVFNRPDARLFRREHLLRTQAFYEEHGGKTIIYARFVPIVRTFAPFVAGVAGMNYGKFLSFNVFGGIGWVASMTVAGYLVGGIPLVQRHFEKAVILIVLVSVLPLLVEAIRSRRRASGPR